MKQVSPPKTGGPVYPGRAHDVFSFDDDQPVMVYSSGLTVRDYFAGLAMQSWLTGVDSPIEERCAEFAYRMADAMLRAREAE